MKKRYFGMCEDCDVGGDRDFVVSAEFYGYHEPAQNGGMTDPSWDAYDELEEVKVLSVKWMTGCTDNEVEVFSGDRNFIRLEKLGIIDDIENTLLEQFENNLEELI